MSTIKVSIKNAGKVYELELNAEDTGLTFKNKIQELTLIPPERQKILIKGGKVNDDDVVSNLNLNTKQPIMVLGTPDKNLPVKPVEKQVFIEDLNENQLVKVSTDPSGLVNMGNTCYLNSSLQALFQVRDVADALKNYQSFSSNSGSSSALVVALKNVFQQMAKKHEKVTPSLFLSLFRNVFPQFAERDNTGYYKQQDAEEAFSQILRVLCDTLKVEDSFKISFKTEQKCLALPDEEHQTGYEDALKLNCHIDIKTNFLRDGILGGLKETIEKFNDTLQSNTEYEISRTITRLPKYLTVHFVRFFWRRDTQKKSKILRRVQFPFELDLAEVLDESIKQEKVTIRDKLRKIEKDNLDLVRDFKKAKKDTTLNPLEQQEEDEMKILSIKSKYTDSFASILPEGFNLEKATENPSSVYELNAIVTHSGSSADSGHYQSFVKDSSDFDGERWWKFNDDKVSSVSKEKIEQLAGGGESDSALILIYKAVGL
ncbi:uncharacterized protein RJT20DRAFT_125244 [Scheffersomyces xylosifermentans]|uniref:uncharacterized protein n=1 Tax=Scheffersomyces xylosifermentans TaxID=1304137 RepID=UPI00315CBEC4